MSSSSMSPPSLVSIPDCSAQHLLGDEQLPLVANAELALVEVKGSTDTPPLTLTFGESIAFPLDPSTIIGTQTGNGQVYLLRPHMKDVTGPQGWVRIELPAGVEEENSELGGLRDRFEEILVQHGFLLGSGIKAGGDELAAGLREAGLDGSQKIGEAVDDYKSSRPPTDTPASFSRATHARAGRVASVSGTAAGYAAMAGTAITDLSHNVGASIARTFGLGQKPEEEKSETRKAVEATASAAGDVATGLTDSTSEVTSSARTGASDVIEHRHGPEAASLASDVGSTGANVASVAGGIYVATAASVHAASAATGATEVDLNPEKAKLDSQTPKETLESIALEE